MRFLFVPIFSTGLSVHIFLTPSCKLVPVHILEYAVVMEDKGFFMLLIINTCMRSTNTCTKKKKLLSWCYD